MSFWTALSTVSYRVAWIDANEHRLRYLDAGGGAEALVFVHGLGGQLELFLHNVAAYAPHYRTIALDLPGHGYSSKPPGNYEIATYVNGLLAFLDALELDKVHLVGLALGGWIAARLAAHHPARVSTLSLIAPGGFAARAAVMEQMKALSAKAATDREGVRARLEWLIRDKALVTQEFVDLRWHMYSQPDYQRVLPDLLCLQQMEIRRRNLLRRDELAAIRAPTFIAWTTRDPIGPVEDGLAFADAIPDARLIVFENSIHLPHYEEADRFNALHLQFLQESACLRESRSVDTQRRTNDPVFVPYAASP